MMHLALENQSKGRDQSLLLEGPQSNSLVSRTWEGPKERSPLALSNRTSAETEPLQTCPVLAKTARFSATGLF